MFEQKVTLLVKNATEYQQWEKKVMKAALAEYSRGYGKAVLGEYSKGEGTAKEERIYDVGLLNKKLSAAER